MNATPKRPVLRWHGGKWKLAPKILPYLPPHHAYVEPYGGAASILLRKPRSYAEVYNDLDDEVVTLFRVLRDEMLAPKLIEALRLTPFARVEFQQAYEWSDDPVELSRRLIIRSFMGFGSDGATKASVKTGFRATSSRSGTTPAHDWMHYPDCLPALIARLAGVTIEHRSAIEVMAQHDRERTLHFVDPPYLSQTRSTKNGYHGYKHEMTDAQHAELLAFLRSLRGGGGAVRLCVAALRRRAGRLAACGIRGAGRWRPAAPGSAVDQRRGLARVDRCRAPSAILHAGGDGRMSRLRLIPIHLREANAFVGELHRHHGPVTGHKVSLGAVIDDALVGVAILGRPVARARDDGRTIEVVRLCTNGAKNTCSFLYGAAARAGFALGYRRIGTYILANEPGTSLRAAGWTYVRLTDGGSWSCPSRPRADKHPVEPKQLWERWS